MSVYRDYEGGKTNPSFLAFAFEQNNAKKLAAPGLIVLAHQQTKTDTTGGSDETGTQTEGTETQELGMKTSIAEKIRNLWNQGQIGKASKLLTKTLYEKKDVDEEVLELSSEIIDYHRAYLPYEKNQLSEINSALQSFLQETSKAEAVPQPQPAQDLSLS